MATQSPVRMLKLGDVYKVPVAQGHAYLQYVFEHKDPPVWGSIVRVLPGIFEMDPPDLDALVGHLELYVAFVTLRLAIKQKEVVFVGSYPISERFEKCPLFKAAIKWKSRPDKSTYPIEWAIWNGRIKTPETPLSREHWSLPTLCLINIPQLQLQIKTGWRPEVDIVQTSTA
jgi:hypothetical protein